MKRNDDGYYCMQIVKIIAAVFLIFAGYGAYVGVI